MKKLKSKAGLTLVETIVSLLILVFMVIGMGPSMDTAAHIYKDANFEADSSMLSSIVNNAMGDVLRFAEKIDTTDMNGRDLPEDIPFVFTSYDYRIQDGYFCLPTDETGILQMKNLRNGSSIDLVNTGAYPDLKVSNLAIVYDQRKGVFTITYQISSISDTSNVRDITYIVRRLSS